VAQLENCAGIVSDVHHKKGRGIYYLDTDTWIAVCRNCHDIITKDSNLAINLNLSEKRNGKI